VKLLLISLIKEIFKIATLNYTGRHLFLLRKIFNLLAEFYAALSRAEKLDWLRFDPGIFRGQLPIKFEALVTVLGIKRCIWSSL